MNTEKAYIGAAWLEDGYIVGMIALEEKGIMAIGLGDGRIQLRQLDKPETPMGNIIHAHKDALSSLLLSASGDALFSAGEDGCIVVLHADGKTQNIFSRDKAVIEHFATHPQSGRLAVAFKKTALVLDETGNPLACFSDHPSAIGGICFDPKGKRLAVSHYNGVSLCWVNGDAAQIPQRLNWKGSHLAINWSPNGKYLLTCMQEGALHGWRLPDFHDFQMSGYALKPKSFAWDASGKWLASSGSVGIICWDCSGKGPMGRGALVLGEACQDVTVKIACHPSLDLVAAGTENGFVYLARYQDENIVWLKTEAKSSITALRWSASGRHLLAGTEDGHAYSWVFTD